MEVPISQFRKDVFALVDQALDGKEVWVRHKGRRVRIVPEGPAPDKLGRITPLNVIAPGTDFEDGAWKTNMMREWEQNWERQLGPLTRPVRTTSTDRSTARKTRRKA